MGAGGQALETEKHQDGQWRREPGSWRREAKADSGLMFRSHVNR